MAKIKDEFLGCEACGTVVHRLRAVKGDHHSVFEWDREPIEGKPGPGEPKKPEADHKNCERCGAALVRLHSVLPP